MKYYTWTCADCPAWAETYWDTSEQANAAADAIEAEHRAACPKGGRLTVIGRPDKSHPEQLGIEQLLGTYDPNEPLLVPAWAVLVSRSLVSFFARQLARGATADLSNPDEVWLWATNITAANPLPDQPRPETMAELEKLLQAAARALGNSLPKP